MANSPTHDQRFISLFWNIDTATFKNPIVVPYNVIIRSRSLVFALLLSTLLLVVPVTQAVATSIQLLGVAWKHNPTVYISLQKGVAPSYRAVIIDALNAWIEALNKEVSGSAFDYTLKDTLTKRETADITITLKKNTGMVLGSTSISSSGGVITSVKITLATQNAVGLPLDPSDVFTIAAHEIGHAWGLGHSNDNGEGELDLMYPAFDFMGSEVEINPSDLDLNAVLAIYGSDGFGGYNPPNPGGTFPSS